MQKVSSLILALSLFTTTAAYCQVYSTSPPYVVGQPDVAIHQHGNSQQVYQYRDNQPIQTPSSNFILDSSTGRSTLQLNGANGFILLIPSQPNSSDDDD